MSRNTRNYQTSDVRELKKIISELKSVVRRLKKDKERLIAENKTLKDGFKESIKYINDELASIPVEDIVKYFARKKKGKLAEVKQVKSAKEKREDARKKFQQWIKRKNKEN